VSATPGIHEHMLAALRRCPGLHAEADHYELMMNVDAVFADERTMTVLEDGSGRKSQEADHQVDQSLNPSTGEVAVILPAPATRDLTEAEWAVVNGDSVEITDGAAAKLRWRISHGWPEIPSDEDGSTPTGPSSSLGRSLPEHPTSSQ
jgi:hypothetical protein